VSSTAAGILQDIVSALRDTGAFREVTLGPPGESSVVPRAHVAYESQDVFPSDDSASGLWGRLRVRVTIHTRSDGRAEGTARAADLAATAAQALLADPYRGQRCRDLPIGSATEIERSEITPGIRRPEVEAAVSVRCHFEEEA
jgi:hypothetical protein